MEKWIKRLLIIGLLAATAIPIVNVHSSYSFGESKGMLLNIYQFMGIYFQPEQGNVFHYLFNMHFGARILIFIALLAWLIVGLLQTFMKGKRHWIRDHVFLFPLFILLSQNYAWSDFFHSLQDALMDIRWYIGLGIFGVLVLVGLYFDYFHKKINTWLIGVVVDEESHLENQFAKRNKDMDVWKKQNRAFILRRIVYLLAILTAAGKFGMVVFTQQNALLQLLVQGVLVVIGFIVLRTDILETLGRLLQAVEVKKLYKAFPMPEILRGKEDHLAVVLATGLIFQLEPLQNLLQTDALQTLSTFGVTIAFLLMVAMLVSGHLKGCAVAGYYVATILLLVFVTNSIVFGLPTTWNLILGITALEMATIAQVSLLEQTAGKTNR